MRRTRIAALATAGALAAAGTGVAVATTTSDDPKEREDAVLADAAKRLDVTPSELRAALSEAEDAQLDADVKAGRLSQEQADAIKKHRSEKGTVLGPGARFGRPELDLHVMPDRVAGPIELLETAANALGISRDQLVERLQDGDSLEEIAKAEGKSVDEVREAVESEATRRLDKAVEDGDLSREQADRLREHLRDMIDNLGEFRLPRFDRGDFGLPDDEPGEFREPKAPDLPWS